MEFDVNMINHLIKSRRSVFPAKYTGETIPDFIIEKMLENANWAPTHRFTEPWRFKVFTGGGLEKLAKFQANMYKDKATKAGDFLENKYQKLLEKPLKCSHIIAIGMRRDPEESIREVEEIASVAMAVQNMYLTATAYGAGCYWGTGGVTYMDDAKPFFDLGENDRFMGFLFVGQLKGELHDGKRQPIDEKVEWIRN